MQTAQGFRISPQQRHVWSLRSEAVPNAFHVIRTIEIAGTLNAERLEAAVRRLVEDHEILRTTFRLLPGTSIPVQLINPPLDDTSVLDRRTLSPGANGDTAEHALQHLRDEPIDMEQGPSVRFVLLQQAPDRHILAAIASALCADLEGLDKILGRVIAGYIGTDTPEETPVQYADLAEWQHSLFEDDGADEAVTFWEDTGFLELSAPQLPFDRGATDESFNPRSLIVSLPADALTSARALAEQLDVTLSALALAAWETVLWRFTGQDSFVVGVACNGRTYEELEDALGPFARDLPKSCTLDGAMTFADVARRVGASVANLFDHQEYFSWDHVDDTAGRWRERYFPVSFRLEERNWRYEASGVTFRPAYTAGSGERFLLRADVEVKDNAWHCQLHFDRARLDARDVERMGDAFSTLIAASLSAPETPLSSLELLRAPDGVLNELAFTHVSSPAVEGIHELFEEWVTRTPDEPAVISGDEWVTYRELGERARNLSHRLHAAGVQRDVPVGLLVHRSVDMVSGILGILRAGGAYVPLDPNYPADRLRFMLEDAGAPVVLTTRGLAAQHDLPSSCHIMYLDDKPSHPEAGSGPGETSGDALAYIIYTSGSTGTPKGVEVTHANLIHSTTVRDAVYDQSPHRFLLLSSFSFDSSVAGIFWTLCRGGALVLPPEGLERDVNALGSLIKQREVSHTLCLPSLYQLLLDHAADQIRSLRTVVVAGEACRPELVATHRKTLPDTSLFNEYGPTEGTVWSTVQRCDDMPAGLVPIGRPLPNTEAYVVDERGRLVPIGVPGELYIGGRGVARGYRNRPDATAQRFVPDAFSGRPGARLYRTGDLARYRADGTLEFMGRVDNQVKIRGYRIELEEIEARLAAIPGIREVAVIAREDVPGDKRLVGYVAPSEAVADVDRVLATLRAQLPEYMIPTAIVRLGQLPKTATGKIDRGALPAPAQSAEAGEDMVAPRTAVEEVLAGLWADVLGRDAVGVHDDFLKMGGHSLLVTQLVARMREAFRLEIPLRMVFEKPTVAKFGDYLVSQSDAPDDLEQTAQVLLDVARMSDDSVDQALAQNTDPR